MVKNLPTMQETWVQSLDQEDPLEKRMATHTSILAWTERPGELQSMRLHSTVVFTATGKDCAPTSFQVWWVHSVVRVSRWEGLELGFVQ